MSLYNLSPQYLVNKLIHKNESELISFASSSASHIDRKNIDDIRVSSLTINEEDKNICCRFVAQMILNKKYEYSVDGYNQLIEELKKYLEDNGMVGKKILKYINENTRNKFISLPYYGHILYIEIVKYLLDI